MAKQIKQFSGTTPPILEKGEMATNGRFLYLGTGNRKYNVFEESFDTEKSQMYHGFIYDAEKGGFILPIGTKLSDLEILIDVLPKTLLNFNNVLRMYIEDGAHIVNDLGRGFSFSTLSYRLAFGTLSGASNIKTMDQPVTIDMTGGTMTCQGRTSFSGIRFISTSDHPVLGVGYGSIRFSVTKCSFDTVYTPLSLSSGANKGIGDSYFKCPNVSLVKDVSGHTSMFRNLSDVNNPPHSLARMLGGSIQVGSDYADLYCQNDSHFYSPCGGIVSIGNQILT